MPLIEVNVTHQVNASIRLDESTVRIVDQYAAMIQVPSDDLVNATLAQTLLKCKEFHAFLKTPEALQVQPALRVRKVQANGAAETPARRPAGRVESPVQPSAVVAGSRA